MARGNPTAPFMVVNTHGICKEEPPFCFQASYFPLMNICTVKTTYFDSLNVGVTNMQELNRRLLRHSLEVQK